MTSQNDACTRPKRVNLRFALALPFIKSTRYDINIFSAGSDVDVPGGCIHTLNLADFKGTSFSDQIVLRRDEIILVVALFVLFRKLSMSYQLRNSCL